MRDENVPILPKHMERDPDKLKLLDSWREALQERHTVATFQESNDLAVQVAADLSRTVSGLEETARAREEARLQSSIPLLDELSKLVEDAIREGATERALRSSLRRSVSEVISERKQLGATVILSYASPDREIVQQVVAGLSKERFQVVTYESITADNRNINQIERVVDSADFIVPFISQNYGAQKELQIALHRQVTRSNTQAAVPITQTL